MKFHMRFWMLLATLALAAGGLALPLQRAAANSVAQTLPFSQNWSDTSLIIGLNNWDQVPGIVGYRGSGLTAVTGVNPQTVLAPDSTGSPNVTPNLTDVYYSSASIGEFEISNPVVALMGSESADAPHLLIALNTLGMQNIHVSYNARDIDFTSRDAVQQVALQYRVGGSGNFTDVPAAYIPDATVGYSTMTTAVSVVLPAAADDQALLELRILTTNAPGNDEWVGVDDISINGDPIPNPPPSVSATTPGNGATAVALTASLSVTFSEAVTAAEGFFDITCTYSGAHDALATSGDSLTYTIDPGVDFWPSEQCTVTLEGTLISEQNGTGQTMAADYVWSFTTAGATNVCGDPALPIYAVQGSGAAAAITGPVTLEGVVVGDYEGVSPNLQGFYLQDPHGDANPATSDGIFVYNGANDSVALGDVVRVSGAAGEYQEQTQLSAITSLTVCGPGTVAPTDVTLPLTSADDLERYEGMLVRLPQTLYVTDNYQLGRFGQVTLSSAGRLRQPTSAVAPGAAALALQAQNDRDRILLDDGTNTLNPDSILFGRGGQPLSAANTLRAGDSAAGIVGVLTHTWGGSTASPIAYRVSPFNALDGSAPDFQPANPRPLGHPLSGGRLLVAFMNTSNYFNTYGSACTLGLDGTPTDCRGADNPAEFERQSTKLVQAILVSGADVIGLAELENDGYGSGSAIQTLVDRLNAAAIFATYTFIDADALTGQVNALGTDAIKVALIYRSDRVTPIGAAAVLNTPDFVRGGDGVDRNRPALAQAFALNADGARFVAVVNHFKSKSSACDTPDAGDGQGDCNAVRTAAATALADWLANDPTAIAEPDVLILGDLNAYAMEDPVTELLDAGYTNLVSTIEEATAYSYSYAGQWGYLDHALASGSLADQVGTAAFYHINAAEPAVLDYNTENKTAGQLASLYAADPYRASDHDPLLIGLNLHSLPRLSSLDLNTPFTSGIPQIFHIDLENIDSGDTYDNVALQLRIANAELADIASFEYLTDAATWAPMLLTVDGADLVSTYGPAGGFPLSAPEEKTFTFRINFVTPEFFHFTVTLDDLNVPSPLPLASLSATALVFTPNSSPVAVDQTFTIAEDTPLSDVLDVTDAEDDTLEFVHMGGPAHGELLLNSATGAFTYTPAAEWSGSDSFTYNVGDGRGGVDSATVTITVTPVNDDPVAPSISNMVWWVGVTSSETLPEFTDIDNSGLAYAATLANGSDWPGWLAFDADTLTLSGKPQRSDRGVYPIRITANDGSGGAAEVVFTLTVRSDEISLFLPLVVR